MNQQLSEIKEALKAATLGPWRVETEHDLWKAIKSRHGFQHTMVADCVHARDAELFAHAPQWLASLVSQVEEMQNTLENLLLHAPENDIFDLYGACEMESDDWRDAKENARQTIQSIKGEDKHE